MIKTILSEYNNKAQVLKNLFLHFNRNLIYNTDALNYCLNRGISFESIKKYCIGYNLGAKDIQEVIERNNISPEFLEECGFLSKNEDGSYYDKTSQRIIFPIQDLTDNYIGFSARVWKENVKRGKYTNSNTSILYQKTLSLYGLNFAMSAIGMENMAFIVEGNVDVISCHQAGIPIAVASCGTAFTKEHYLLLRQFTNRFVFCFDNDEGGKKSTEKIREMLSTERDIKVGYIELTGVKDVDDLIRECGPDGLKQRISEFSRELLFKI